MSSRQAISPEVFEQQTRPRLLLFLSVDLENSTALKQNPTSRIRQEWLGTVVSFIEEFPQTFKAQIERIARGKHLAAVPQVPKLWKIQGDELLFSVPVDKHSDVTPYLTAFRDALAAWNREIRGAGAKDRLLVKGAAWVAGFPVANAILQGAEGSEDYIGPSIDAGFRIAKLATPRRLIVSVELGWMLLECGCRFPLHFEGRRFIKGVAESSGYPELWIEVENSAYQAIEDNLLGHGEQQKPDLMKELCASFIKEFGVPKHLPFLPGDPTLGLTPEGFENELAAVKQFLRDEVYLITGEPEPVKAPADQIREEQDLMDKLRESGTPDS